MSRCISPILRAAFTCLILWTGIANSAFADWTVVVPAALHADEAISVALDDLVQTGASLNQPVGVVADTGEMPATNLLYIGRQDENRATADFAKLSTPPDNPEGFRIESIAQQEHNSLVLTSNGPLGYAYGLYWIRDRLLVNKHIPADLEALRSPAFPVRLGGAWGRWGFGGRNKDQMRIALRNSINWVAGAPILDLVPWDSEPEAANNAKTREETRALIEYAHTLHMNYFAFANEFTYHPSLLEKRGASLSPDDPRFWDALQDKFRMLFTALPELDGIELCNDDISGFWEHYRPYDLLHENPEADWSYPKRFRTFVKRIHEVVAGEFGKEYFHFTWSLSDHEQHTQPAVYREIFTGEIPTDHLYVMPKVTRADRWWHQAYNPTFNLTPHKTVVLFEAMNYYEGGGTPLFPTFSGDYFQRGLQTFLLPEDSNVEGIAMLASIPGDGWGTRDAYAYVLYRLLWNPNESMEAIARDFCAIHFGPELAEDLADLYLDSARAYKYGLHIEPISYGQFNSFTHMRVGVFPAEGYPEIDRGREHLEWLKKIYLRIKPWEEETLQDIQHGRDVAEGMYQDFQAFAGRIHEDATRKDLEIRLNNSRYLIETNQRYVEGMLAYFDYLENPTAENRSALGEVDREMKKTMDTFSSLPGFDYKLWGVEVLSNAIREALADVLHHQRALESAPTRSALEQHIRDQQQRASEILADDAIAKTPFARIRIQVDGRDLLLLRGDSYEIKHIRWDHPDVQAFESIAPLPERAVTVIPRDIESRPLHPFVLEQPGAANDYTAKVYLDDLPGGQGWMEFELVYVEKKPEELGLAPLRDQVPVKTD